MLYCQKILLFINFKDLILYVWNEVIGFLIKFLLSLDNVWKHRGKTNIFYNNLMK